ncbi:restriction endonuclease subunit S [Pseudomonas gingeri]|uniref:restriction endonuclease subunit S n=1 Tax=Pseudomonas gingeri TaxID=117681 RepID=UPI0015A230B0|nr:restriction endonuclease subunit S [Pseudomonas gingeri]NWD66161.1 restriction endonuclease subunit S [Pseudomonas gingeri]
MELKPGYKQTEVGVIPEDWLVQPLGELTAMMTNGFVGVATRHYTIDDSAITYIQGYNVKENSFNLHGVKYVTENFHNQHLKSCLREGDLLTVQTGDVGLTTIVPSNLSGANCHALIISRVHHKRITPKFLSYYLNSNPGRSRLKLIETGTTMKHLNVGDMLRFNIPLPSSLAEQQVITETLSDSDTLIESLRQLLTKKHQIKQGTMQELLTGQRRLPGFSGEWQPKKLKDLATIQRGASPRPIDNPIWFDESSKVGWVRISDVTKSGMYLEETTQRLSIKGIQYSRPVAEQSLIMSICATVGRPIITKIKTCIHDGFVVFEKLLIEKNFLYYTLSFIEENWSRHGQTGSQTNLNINLIKSTTILVPPTFEEQTAVSSTLFAIDSEITALETQLQKAHHIKQGMMQELLTGRIRLV